MAIRIVCLSGRPRAWTAIDYAMTPTVPTPGEEAVMAASRNGHHSHEDYGPPDGRAWLDIDWREHQRWVSVEGHRST